jgi:CHASE2 domain-containing sensor protein
VIDRLREDGARVIGYDVEFTEPSSDADETEALLEAVARTSDKVVLATYVRDRRSPPPLVFGAEILDEIQVRPGNTLLPEDADGVTRRLFYSIAGVKSFGLVVAELASGRTITRDDVGDGVWIDFLGPPRTVPHHSFSRVMNGQFKRGTFRDAVVVVGPTAPGLRRLHATRVGKRMDGPELQANAIATALAGFPLHAPGWRVMPIAVVALALLGAIARLRLRLAPAVGVVLLVAASYLVLAQAAFNAGLVLPVVAPLVLTVALSDGPRGVRC